ncbi:hypothetical protein GGR34_000844 [Microvirga flocculans]|uniref:Uncharacterized protein n=1 Tax=Microvirga flocculans TaxID=217168 RepID=A0A7W6IE68_9HYPH|nr:hypothetical protein [Microvirga flocculans]MBB4039209.1 hypothetical protein [Microvirga flocculans]
MKKFLIATSTLICLMGAPLAAQAAASSSQPATSTEKAQPPKHATVRHHTAKHRSAMNQSKKHVKCAPGSQNPACHPTSTGSVR